MLVLTLVLLSCSRPGTPYNPAQNKVRRTCTEKTTVNDTKIYILGAGAIGLALAASLIKKGENVLVVRTSTTNVPENTVEIALSDGNRPDSHLRVPAYATSLAQLEKVQGIIVITAKAYANPQIAEQLQAKAHHCPVIIMQNGLGVEEAYLSAGFADVYRCVLYATSQKIGAYQARFRPVRSSPIGLIKGTNDKLAHAVQRLHSEYFPFHVDPNIQESIWKKAIINAVFNTICPLLEVDNGIFARDPSVAEIAKGIVGESVQVAQALGVALDQQDVMTRILQISKGADGQLISTLQDLNKGNRTEIESLNLEIARLAKRFEIDVRQTKLLGELILMKSNLTRNSD